MLKFTGNTMLVASALCKQYAIGLLVMTDSCVRASEYLGRKGEEYRQRAADKAYDKKHGTVTLHAQVRMV